jgi:hypothetical protein
MKPNKEGKKFGRETRERRKRGGGQHPICQQFYSISKMLFIGLQNMFK